MLPYLVLSFASFFIFLQRISLVKEGLASLKSSLICRSIELAKGDSLGFIQTD